MTRSKSISRQTLQQRLDCHSERDPATGCVLWTAGRNANGYGILTAGGTFWLAHRAA